MDDFYIFTTTYDTIVNRLSNMVKVSSERAKIQTEKEYKAVWDTGASETCISSTVVADLGLVLVGQQTNSTTGGTCDSNIYIIDILLPNNVKLTEVKVSEVYLEDCDLLIGMDIIKFGDFLVSNFEGQTKFTFRIPSKEHSDYTIQK